MGTLKLACALISATIFSSHILHGSQFVAFGPPLIQKGQPYEQHVTYRKLDYHLSLPNQIRYLWCEIYTYIVEGTTIGKSWRVESHLFSKVCSLIYLVVIYLTRFAFGITLYVDKDLPCNGEVLNNQYQRQDVKLIAVTCLAFLPLMSSNLKILVRY